MQLVEVDSYLMALVVLGMSRDSLRLLKRRSLQLATAEHRTVLLSLYIVQCFSISCKNVTHTGLYKKTHQ